MDRRSFLARLLGSLGAGLALLPVAGSLIEPLRRARRPDPPFVPLGPAFKFRGKGPRLVSFIDSQVDAWETRTVHRSVYVTHLGEDRFRVQSPVCPHLGCPVAFDKTDRAFRCPCHDSRFAPEGEAKSGPSKRGLDELPHKVENGRLLVRWVEFEPDRPDRKPL